MVHADGAAITIIDFPQVRGGPVCKSPADGPAADAAALALTFSPPTHTPRLQMVSMDHLNAREMFERDVTCLRLFFRRRFGLEDAEYPTWASVVQRVRRGREEGESTPRGRP